MHYSAFCNPADVEAFTEEKKKTLLVKRQGKGADFVRAVEEIIDSYEKAKKQDQVFESNSGDEGAVSNTGNSEGSMGKLLLKVQKQSPGMITNPLSETLHASAGKNELCNPVEVPVDEMEITDLCKTGKASGELIVSDLLLDNHRETPLEASNSLGKRLRDTPLQGCITQRRAMSVRRSRTSSRVDPCKLQNLIMQLNHCRKTSDDTVYNVLLDESVGNKRTKHSLGTPIGHETNSPAHSPAFASNGNSEDTVSEVIATTSDSVSLNESSAVESHCKIDNAEVSVHLKRDVELHECFDLGGKAVVLKKRRKLTRKRASKDAGKFTSMPDNEEAPEDVASKSVTNVPKKLNESFCKGDGDGHLPLVKRARVRMGEAAIEDKELNKFMQKGDKSSEGLLGNNIEQASTSFCYVGNPPEDTSIEVKGCGNSCSSPSKGCTNFIENGTLFWKATKFQLRGRSIDVEAALPPSKRLHRALEAMSANAAEDDEACIEATGTTKMLSNRCNASYTNTPHIPMVSIEGNAVDVENGEVDKALEVQNTKSCDKALEVRNMNSCTKTCLEGNSGFPTSLTPPNSGSLTESSSEMHVSDHLNQNPISPINEDYREKFEARNGVGYDHDISSVYSIAKTDIDVRNSQPCLSNSIEGKVHFLSEQALLLHPPGSIEEVKSNIIDMGNKCLDDYSEMNNDVQCAVQGVDPTSKAKEVENILHLNSDGMILSATDEHSSERKESLKCQSDEACNSRGMYDVVKEFKQTQIQRDTQTSTKILIAASQAKGHLSCSKSFSDNLLDNRVASDAVSSPSPTTRIDSHEKISPDPPVCHESSLDNKSKLVHNGSGNPDILPHHKKTMNVLDADEVKFESAVTRRDKSLSKWIIHAEANAARRSFEMMLGTLSRTKESIGRATRLAMDCAKYGIAYEVVDILVRNLENESSLHKRVDLFFLVDSITQCSRGQKGDVGDIYPLAVQAMLPRLLSAAAPPGNAARENRKQCLKVLRLWLERKALPESIIRHHMQELDSLTDTSLPSTSSRRSSRSERALNDPVREMDGMLVDEYGSNASFKISGFHMPRMLEDQEGSDDEKCFEAVTPEHVPEVPKELETTSASITEKRRHILEDVDGELEMEDVAPLCEAEANTIYNVAGIDTAHTSYCQFEPQQPLTFAPPLPEDMPPSPPPLPTSPPPIAPPSLPPPPPVMSHCFTDVVDQKIYLDKHSQQENMQQSVDQQTGRPNVNSVTLDAASYYAPEHRDLPKQMQRSSSSGSCGTLPGSHPSVHSGNNVQQTDGVSLPRKAYHLQPPPPLVSNQFSYVHADRCMPSWRETSSPSFSKRFQFGHDNSEGKLYNGQDRMKVAPREIGERVRLSAPFRSGLVHFDKADMSYAPISYYGPPLEPMRASSHGWAFPPRVLNYRHSMPSLRPSEVPNFWRPR
ncbi:PREDICTED: protein HUA2-LIKE 2-like isoform X2 [Nelumbo nucifera]|uniref:Protein HUA2-LIKE 2-like isoform X2 n=1 Tax=Nelumbo nucifera TaxID=4432 RepID=A0A1U8BMJ2_NELNU|nr:PREDICTED: protein HUA2-LIKE 2-like isoform X2 [Nelumbo nucifera]